MTANYSDRTVDYLIFQGVKPEGEVLVNLGLGTSGSVCTGAQKMAQTFIKLFLTDKGSVMYDEAAGTDFRKSVRNGAVHDDVTLESYFRFAVMDILNYLSTQPTPEDKDEVLEEAKLTSYDLIGDSIILHIELVSLVGTTRSIIIPVKTVIR